MQILTQEIKFPDAKEASPDGLLAIGGDLSVKRLVYAYKHGIFPWFNEDDPILWWSPNPRFVLFPKNLKISKSMKQILRNKNYRVTINNDFRAVINACSKIKRTGQTDTWITDNMIEAYVTLHKLGYAKSVEVWDEQELVGGFYGVDLKNGIFSGESMFSKVSNASKIAFISFVENTNYNLIDCQVYTKHLKSLGAENISRDCFMAYLNES